MKRGDLVITTVGAVVAAAIASGIAWAASPGGERDVAAQQATKPSVTNDGLPRQWFGVTKWTAGLSGVQSFLYPSTDAEVTLTLTKKGPYANKDGSAVVGKSGTIYRYVPTGKITVDGWCPNTPITVPLKPIDGVLDILVPKNQGKRSRAAYVGADTAVLISRQPNPCPNGTRYNGIGSGTDRWGFKTEFFSALSTAITPAGSKPVKRYRHTISTTAETIAGTYLEDDTFGAYQPLDKFTWCFVRNRRDLGKCK